MCLCLYRSVPPKDAEKTVLPGKFFEKVGEVAWVSVFGPHDVNCIEHSAVVAAYHSVILQTYAVRPLLLCFSLLLIIIPRKKIISTPLLNRI